MKQRFSLLLFVCILCIVEAHGQKSKAMAITIDDLPNVTLSTNDTVILEMNQKILEALYDYAAPAVGFVNEIKLVDNSGEVSPMREKVLDLWLKAGMELGNHTYAHPDYNQVSPEFFFEDITDGEKHLKSLMARYNKKLRYFRHPYLHRGDTREKVVALEAFLAAKGYTEAPVTISNSEYIFARAYEIALSKSNDELAATIGNSYLNYMMEKIRYYENQSEKLVGRQISQVLLLHANLLNADYLAPLLGRISDHGYRFIFLEEVLKDPVYQTEDKFVTRSGISWIHRWAISRGENPSFFKGDPPCPQYVQKLAGVFE